METLTEATTQENNNVSYPGLTSDPASIAFLSNKQYLAAFSLGAVTTALSLFGSASIIIVITRAKKLHELSNRLILGISALDIIVCLSIYAQPLMMRKDSGLMFARGNIRTCDAVGFFFNYFVGGVVYNCALSIYYLLRIRYNKKDHQITKYLEPYVHMLALGEPTVVGIATILTDGFNPNLPAGICGISGVYPAACAFRDEIECQRGGSLSWAILSNFQTALPLLSSVIAATCTTLVYWTARRQLHSNTRYVIRTATVPSATNDALTPQQRKLIRTVALQAVLYFLSYFICFVVVLISVTQNEIYSSGIQDISEVSDKRGAVISYIMQYLLFPLNGFWNMLIFFRPRVARWKEKYPDRGWFWAYLQVLSGKSPPKTRTSESRETRERPRRSLVRTWSSMLYESKNKLSWEQNNRSSQDVKRSSNMDIYSEKDEEERKSPEETFSPKEVEERNETELTDLQQQQEGPG